MSKTLELGSMKFTNEIRVSDPCYDKDTWCNKLITNARPGIWRGYALKGTEDDWGERIQHMAIVHVSMSYEYYMNIKGRILFEKLTRLEGADIGVDSGQAGFFREDCFDVIERAEDSYKDRENDPWEQWYKASYECTYQELPPLVERDPGVMESFTRRLVAAAVQEGVEITTILNEQLAYINSTRPRESMHAAKFTYKGIDQGFNSSSGLGDGGYPLFVKELEGEIVAMFVPFTYGPKEEADDDAN